MANLFCSEKLKELRRRLGYSQGDLARRLQIQVESVRSWELNQMAPTAEEMVQLEILLSHAELCSQEVQSLPAIENEMQQKSVNQIHSSTI